MNGQRLVDRLLANVGIIVWSGTMACLFGTGWNINRFPIRERITHFRETLVIGILFFVIFLLLAMIYGAFTISVLRSTQLALNQILSLFITDFVMYCSISLFRGNWNGRYLWLVFPLQCIVAVLFSRITEKLYFCRNNPQKTVIIDDAHKGIRQIIHDHGLDRKFNVVREVTVDEFLRSKDSILSEADVFFTSGMHSHDRNTIIKYCVEKNKEAYVIPLIGDMIMSSASPVHMLHIPVFRIERYHPTLLYFAGKRIFDIFVSASALIILFPVMAVISAAIWLHDKGPVFYRQCRLTRDGKEFYILKFRSMRTDAEKDGIARLSTGTADDRITPVGRVIRKIRADELPQLINILKGDMSVVGPRPERPEIAADYETRMPEFRLRLQVKAGLTGYAQVYGRYNSTPYDKLLMDLNYIAHPGLIRDFGLCLATIRVLLEPESTAGIEEGTTADPGGKDIYGEADVVSDTTEGINKEDKEKDMQKCSQFSSRVE